MSMPAERYPSPVEGRSSTRIRSPSSPHSEMAVERLTDDLLIEILSRAPVKSLCRFKCVSNHWLSLIDHPDHRKKLPQTMVGFFYTSTNEESLPKSDLHFLYASTSEKPHPESALRFFYVSENRRRPLVCPSFAFLPSYRRVDLLDSCNGLLLCRWYGISTIQDNDFRYVVCNPATEEWVALPDPSHAGNVGIMRLGFDPALSSHFHVFLLLVDDGRVFTGANLYSSETRRWVHKDRGCKAMRLNPYQPATAFLNGYLHFHTIGIGPWWGPCLAAVDTKGETWMNFNLPGHLYGGFIQQSQGRLHYTSFVEDEDAGVDNVRLVVYVMQDYDNKEWTLKHSIEATLIYGGIDVSDSSNFHWIAIHPDSNLIFFTRGGEHDFPVMCYNMDPQQTKWILNLRNVCPQYVPYVPLYSELQSLHM